MVIDGWSAAGSACGVGTVTGEASGLIVVDVDRRNGANASLAALEARHGPLASTLDARTGGGGREWDNLANKLQIQEPFIDRRRVRER